MFLVNGVVFTPSIIGDVMNRGISYGQYWIDDIELLQPRIVARWYDPAIWAGSFQIRVEADDAVNFVASDDVQRALEEMPPSTLQAIQNRYATGDQSDRFFQTCVFGQVVYTV